MLFWPPPESAPGFDRLKWVELFRGPYRDAEPVLAKLKARDFPTWWTRFDIVHGTDEVVISVPERLKAEVDAILASEEFE
jgi:hypothetical protein